MTPHSASGSEGDLRGQIRQAVERELRAILDPSAGGSSTAPAATAPSSRTAVPTARKSGDRALREVIALGADHGGYELKQALVAHLTERGFAIEDCGTHSTESCDYPVFARAVADRVASGAAALGIVIDGAGIGSCMVANKVSGVRAAHCDSLFNARNAREHNHANILTLGAGTIGAALAKEVVDRFLSTPCGAGRHARRVALFEGAGSSGGDTSCNSER